MAFLIPTVNSIGEKGFEDIKVIANALLSTFGIKKYGGVHVGIVTCAEVGNVIMKFDDSYYKSNIRRILKSLKLQGRRLVLEECLREASNNLFDVRGGVRTVADKYLIVIGDNSFSFSKQVVDKALLPLKNQGVKIKSMSLGTDPAAAARMRSISSEPKSIWFRQVQSEEVLNAGYFARSITEGLCKGKKRIDTSATPKPTNRPIRIRRLVCCSTEI